MLTPKETLLLKLANAHICDFENDMVDYWSANNYALHNQMRDKIKALTTEYENTYHEYIPEENINKLKAFALFDESHYRDFNKYPVLDRGRGANIANNINRSITAEFSVLPNNDGSIQIDDVTYVSAKGDILADCDLSYDTMPNYTLGNTKNIDEFIKYLRTL